MLAVELNQLCCGCTPVSQAYSFTLRRCMRGSRCTHGSTHRRVRLKALVNMLRIITHTSPTITAMTIYVHTLYYGPCCWPACAPTARARWFRSALCVHRQRRRGVASATDRRAIDYAVSLMIMIMIMIKNNSVPISRKITQSHYKSQSLIFRVFLLTR